MALLVAGGCRDHNLNVLADAGKKAGVDIVDLRLPVSESPPFCWNPEQGWVRLSHSDIQIDAAFIRYDVFSSMKDSRPAVAVRSTAWYHAVWGWLLSDSRIRIFNRNLSPITSNKPATLVQAHQVGLRIPSTLITNDIELFTAEEAASLVAKPVAGGDYCYSLEEALGKANLNSGAAASPAIVQNRLVSPEVRIYVIGEQALAFELRSKSLDYRKEQDVELVLMPELPKEVEALRQLMSRLGADFGAADFKTDPQTGELIFLELNTSPMFERFDHASQGQLCAAILDHLTQ